MNVKQFIETLPEEIKEDRSIIEELEWVYNNTR